MDPDILRSVTGLIHMNYIYMNYIELNYILICRDAPIWTFWYR